MLLECPHRPTAGTEFHAFVHGLGDQGERIVLAHPERSPVFQRHPDRLAALVRDGVLTSITAASLLGSFGRTVQSFSLRLLREGLVHNVASDSHDAERRGPELLAGLQATEREVPGALRMADWLTRQVPEAILVGDELPLRPELPPQRGGVRRWLDRLRGSGA
jgi:protein-tyrosine phosphatase